MSTVDAVCSQCEKDMIVEPQGDFIRLSCACGNHKMVNISLLKSGKDTQPVPVITKEMTEEEIHSARQRMATEDSRDGFSGDRTIVV